jgi:acyl carrier protein
MINDYLSLTLQYPLPPEISIRDLKSISQGEASDHGNQIVEAVKKHEEIDSIDILELVIQIEEEFGSVIDDKEVATLLQWSDLIGYIYDTQKDTGK